VRWLLVLVCACSSASDPPPPTKAPRGTTTADSTVAARDYIGPDACGECHPDQHKAWRASLHSTMNQRAAPAAILGTDVTLDYAGGTMTFQRASQTMTLAKGDRTERYRVTRTIGTRGLQEYVGIAEGTREEVRLPFAWWPRKSGWYPQPYFDPWLDEAAFDPYARVTEPWAERCPWCHSTYPFAQRIARSAARRVGHGLEQFFESPPAGDRLAVDQQVSVGISCESCHLGGRAHAAGAPIHFIPVGAPAVDGAPRPTTFAAERADPAIVNRVCAQCHSGPSPRFPDGSATRNSSEALDLAASACTARCVDCHDPHRADSREDDARAIAACTRCHGKLAGAAHAGPGHDKTSCLDCHMPKIVMGIDRHVRTHRIGSPTDRRMLGAAGPNACNLCHLDRSIKWTTDALLERYFVKRDPVGPYSASVGETWLASKEPAIRLIGAAAYARSPLGRPAVPALARLLDDPRAYVRVWVAFALEDILGPIDYDPRAPTAVRHEQAMRLAERYNRPP
jgi:hypothetical protein